MVLLRPSLLGPRLSATYGIRELDVRDSVSELYCLFTYERQPRSCLSSGHYFNPDWLALGHSRGYESLSSKAFMRASVLALDCAIYIPSVLAFSQTWWKARSHRTQVSAATWVYPKHSSEPMTSPQVIAALTVLLQPSLIIIDNGHFQCVFCASTLGLF